MKRTQSYGVDFKNTRSVRTLFVIICSYKWFVFPTEYCTEQWK